MILLVTGTDTGVGKTVIAGALAIAARQSGRRVAVLKPVETGCTGRPRRAVDAEVLAECASTRPDEAVLWKLRAPLAPAVAAERERAWIAPPLIARRVWELEAEHELVIVEGAGGLRVPLTWQKDYLDLALDVGARVVVVARAGLGTINHTLLTLDALRQAKATLQGVVLNAGTPARDLATRTNGKALRRLASDVRFVEVPFVRAKSPLSRCRAVARFVGTLL